MATRVSSARFVGRVDQLAELCSALEDAAASHPSLAFVAGESGSGKTRLIGELASRAREAGALVLSGDCVELGEGELPYAPLIAALRPLVRAHHAGLAALDPSQLADLATVIPGTGEPSAEAPVEQVRVFEALLALLELLGEDAAVLLVVEDVHWADSSHARLSVLSDSDPCATSASWWWPATDRTSCTAAIRCARCWLRWCATALPGWWRSPCSARRR